MLKKAERAAVKSGVDLTPWEGDFLNDVSLRVKTYGRAFADPDKGAPGHALSMMQAYKLRQILAKAKGEDKVGGASRRGHGAARRAQRAEPEPEDD